ncbi:MAG: acyl-CoA dehydrogenase family protein [Myxococcota bacterium]
MKNTAEKNDVRAVLAELAPRWGDLELAAENKGATRLDPGIIAGLRDSGVLKAPLPEALGGWGATLFECCEAMRKLARYAPSTALALAMPWGNTAIARLPAEAIAPGQRAEQRKSSEWVAAAVRAGKILAVANAEPGSHGDLQQTKSTAKADNDRILLSGRKAFATFGPDADYFLCAARNGDVVDGFFVARDAKGLTLDSAWNAWGMRSTASVGLTLEGAEAASYYGHPGSLSGINARHWSTILFAAVFVGIGDGALALGAEAVSNEAVWARGKLAEHALALDAAWGFVESVAMADGWPFAARNLTRAKSAKTFAARSALAAASDGLVVSGSRAYASSGRAGKLIADAMAGSLLRPPVSHYMDDLVDTLKTRV